MTLPPPITVYGPPPEPVAPRDNAAHVVPDHDPHLEHITTGAHCPCWPSVLEVTDPDQHGATIGYVLRHHPGGIAEDLDPADLHPTARRYLPSRTTT